MPTETDSHRGEDREQSPLTESRRHRLLSVERRRTAIDVLAECDLPIGVAELAEEVVAREGRAADADGGTAADVAVSLHHHHVPALADAGVVDYDPTANRIETRRSNFDALTR
jgi:hypothetical protein